MTKRTKIDIIYDMLNAINEKQGKIIVTHLLYKSNLSYPRLKAYLVELKEKKLIEENIVKDKTHFKLTEQGLHFLANYKKVREFTDAFGL